MALLGENGAGKSTLMKILSGVYTRDSGDLEIFGRKITGDLNTKQAQELGVAIIHQELNMCQHLTVYEIMSCRIPKLTLQPILENSIIHGTELKIGTGNLYLDFARTQDRLLIRISDDGVGMDEETLARLNRKLSRGVNAVSGGEERGGIALVNVNNRIHLIFGDEYGIHVYSVPQVGTDVEITLPFVTRDSEVRNRSVLS